MKQEDHNEKNRKHTQNNKQKRTSNFVQENYFSLGTWMQHILLDACHVHHIYQETLSGFQTILRKQA